MKNFFKRKAFIILYIIVSFLVRLFGSARVLVLKVMDKAGVMFYYYIGYRISSFLERLDKDVN